MEMSAIRQMIDRDWSGIRAIYQAGIATGNATFEVRAPTKRRFLESHIRELSLVARG